MALLITEYTDSKIQYITEKTASGEKQVYIEGVFMQANKKNRNGRIYDRSILESAVEKYRIEQVETGRAVGELNHPEGPSINLDKVSHRIVSLKWDGDNVVGKALVLNTPMGQIVKGLVEGGVKLGVSSRGMGTLEERGAASHVRSDFILATVDIVQDPSAPEAFVNGIMESVDWVRDGSVYRPRKKSVSEKVNNETEISKMLRENKLLSDFTGFLSKL